MAQLDGRLIQCDRCGRQIFLKHKGTKEYDGGYTTVEVYEEKPQGWTMHGQEGMRDLCPECSAEWENLKTRFMQSLAKET